MNRHTKIMNALDAAIAANDYAAQERLTRELLDLDSDNAILNENAVEATCERHNMKLREFPNSLGYGCPECFYEQEMRDQAYPLQEEFEEER